MYCFRSSMPKFFIKTYGCQMNERDSEQVAHSLIARGYERVANEKEADVVLLNTCSVRDMADQKALGKTARSAIAPYQNRAMDDLRSSIVDIAEEPGSESTIRDQQLAPRQATAFV